PRSRDRFREGGGAEPRGPRWARRAALARTPDPRRRVAQGVSRASARARDLFIAGRTPGSARGLGRDADPCRARRGDRRRSSDRGARGRGDPPRAQRRLRSRPRPRARGLRALRDGARATGGEMIHVSLAVADLLEWLSRINPWSLLEIFIIFIVIYTFLRFMEGTRGEGILKGMALVMLLFPIVVTIAADSLGTLDR